MMITGLVDGSPLRRLHGKWKRDESLPPRARVAKAAAYARDVARAQVHLRRATVLTKDTRSIGRPIVHNDGTLDIGRRCWFRSIVAPVEITVASGAVLTIGSDSHINSGTTICAYRRVEIGQRTEIAPFVSIYDTNFHQVYDRNAHPEPRPVVIEDDVWICAKATILPGVRIGRGAIVSPHALVTKDVEPWTIVSGVPATVVKRLDPERFVLRSHPDAGAE